MIFYGFRSRNGDLLHLISYFGGQFEAHAFKQGRRLRLWFCDRTKSGGRGLIAHRHDDIHGMDGAQFLDGLAGAVAQTLGFEPHLQASPHERGKVADKDVDLDLILFWVIDQPKPRIAFAGVEGILNFGKLDITMPGLSRMRRPHAPLIVLLSIT